MADCEHSRKSMQQLTNTLFSNATRESRLLTLSKTSQLVEFFKSIYGAIDSQTEHFFANHDGVRSK